MKNEKLNRSKGACTRESVSLAHAFSVYNGRIGNVLGKNDNRFSMAFQVFLIQQKEKRK